MNKLKIIKLGTLQDNEGVKAKFLKLENGEKITIFLNEQMTWKGAQLACFRAAISGHTS